MNPVFSDPDFWRGYFTLETRHLSDEDLAAHLEGFRSDFDVREETHQFEGMDRPFVSRFVSFPFFCGDGYSMVVDYETNTSGCTINLFLRETDTGTRKQMGWWNLAQWHPFCLRMEELDLLTRFQAAHDERWEDADLPFLLLCPFVGSSDAESLELLKGRESLRRIGVKTPSKAKLELHVAEGGYRWEKDPDVGWVFTSDEYYCYSLRNREHAGSGEGCFPFQAFADMMTVVRRETGDTSESA